MVDFKETAYEIFKIVTDIKISDGHAAEKIEEILRNVYNKGKEDGFHACDHMRDFLGF